MFMRCRITSVTLAILSLFAPRAFAAPPINRVNVMPDRQVRPGVALPVFGSADGGAGTHNADGSKYTWTFTFNPAFVSVSPGNIALTTVTNDRNIVTNQTFTLLGGATRQFITATLTVRGTDGSVQSASAQIDIVALTDQISNTPLGKLAVDTNIAIENALRAMYLAQTASNGGWDYNGTTAVGGVQDCAATAINVWAFSNSGHRPTNSAASDIYSPWVQKGVNFILTQSSSLTLNQLTASFYQRIANATIGFSAIDGNANNRVINLCPGNPEGYASPMAAAALEAAYSGNPQQLHATGTFANNSYFTIVQDAIDWFSYTQMDGAGGCGPAQSRGGWRYTATSCDSGDTSIDSWNYVAMEGFEQVFGGTVHELVKREAELRLDSTEYDGNHVNTPGDGFYGRFGYSHDTSFVGGFDQAKTGGGLSGLNFVSHALDATTHDRIDRTGYYLDPAGAGSSTATSRTSGGPSNTRGSFGGIAGRKAAALRHLGFAWTEDACCSWGGNRGNFYSMWTQARALRLNGTTQLFNSANGGTVFDWQTGETTTNPGQVPGPGPLEGYFPYLVRTQSADGSWPNSSFNGAFTRNLNTGWGILTLQPKVFPVAGNCGQAGATVAPAFYPLDHGFRNVTITGVPAGVTIQQVCQDEDPNFENVAPYAIDGGGLGTATGQIRAEFSGSRTRPSNGRVYTIKFSAPSLQCLSTVKVGVPTTPTGTAVDDGPLWNSLTGVRDCVIGATGPSVSASAASGPSPFSIDRIVLTFTEVIDGNTFTLLDVQSLTGPSGAIAPTSIFKVDATHYEVRFAPQTAPGNYTLTINPQIADLVGNLMDQNHNSVNGEAPGDQYTASFLVQNSPVLTQVSPNAAQQGTVNLPVTITGNFTHFSASSIVSFGAAGLSAGPPTAATATSVTVPVSIADATALGPTSVAVFTGGESVSLANAFTVIAGTPIITQLSRTSAQQGATNLALTITGRFTHFNNSSVVMFTGAGITVGPPSAATPLSLTVPITIADSAPLGLQALQVVTGGETVSVANAFAVLAGTPIILTVAPNTGQQGQQNESVSITGRFTHWANGTTVASFGAGISASVSVTSPTSATATLNIDPTAVIGDRLVTLTTSGEVVTVTNGFKVTPGTPVLTLVNPNSGVQGQPNELVTLTGQYTHFQQGVTTASFGSGIAVSQLTVNSPTSATAKINIDPSAALGFRNVTVSTGAEVVALNNAFTVNPGVAIVTQVNPNTGQQNQQNESVAISSLFSHLVQGVTTASFGAGITVNSLVVNSATSATASLSIDPAAALGPRTVTLTTDAEVASMADGFTVLAGAPVLTLVSPNTGQQGQANQVVNVTGRYTNFVQGTTLASFGPGITIGNISVTSPTTAAITVTISNTAPLGARNVTLTTGSEIASIANGFTVNAGTPVITLVSPNSGQQGVTVPVTLTGQFTHFSGSSVVTFSGTGVTAGAPTNSSLTSLTVPVTVDGLAPVGLRDLQVVTAGETVNLPAAFTVVLPGTPVLTLVNPNVGHQTEVNRNIVVTGLNTHFVHGTTTADFGAGVTVNSVTVADLTHATANINIADDAPLGGRDVTLTTGSEAVTLANGFTVNSLGAIATVQLTLSQNIVNAFGTLTYSVSMFDGLNNLVVPPDPADCSIASGAGSVGPTPAFAGANAVNTFGDTRGTFTVSCSPHGTVTPTAAQSFVVVAPPDTDTNGNFVTSQAGMFTGFSKSVSDAQEAIAAIQDALINGLLGDIPALAAQLETARTSTDYMLMRASVPFSPEDGFPMTPNELSFHGFGPGPNDGVFYNDVAQLINTVKQATAFLKGLNMATVTDPQLAQMQAYNASMTALATQFAGRQPTLNGVVSASGLIDVLLAQSLPAYFNTLATKLQEGLHVNGVAANNVGVAKQYLALVGPDAAWDGSPAAFYTTARPAFIGLLLGMIGEGSVAVKLINGLYGEAFKYIENAAILLIAEGLLKDYDNFAYIDFLDTGGNPLSGFYFFRQPFSMIEGGGFNDLPALNQVWLIGPDQLNAARDILNLFSGLPSKPNWKSLGEVWKFFEDVYNKLKDAAAAGTAGVEAVAKTDQPPDGFSTSDFCLLSDTCQDLIYSNGFGSVYSQGLIPSPVLLIYKNLETGYFHVGTYNFFSFKEP
jgi:hypothetical protein